MKAVPASLMNSAAPARIVYLAFALGCIGHGLWLLVDPAGWNELLRMQAEDFGGGSVPLYLLRKAGVTYLCISLAFLWCVMNPGIRRRVHPVLALFFVLTAAVHAAEIVTTGAPGHRWVTDFPFIFLPPLVLLAMMVPLPDFSLPGHETGRVKWFDTKKGFGFIVRGNGQEIFVHYRSIRGQGHRALKDGQPVRFRVTTGEKGLQAEDVTPVGNAGRD
ncbi:MAG: cold-shock protein [Pseudomonadota bacterium]